MSGLQFVSFGWRPQGGEITCLLPALSAALPADKVGFVFAATGGFLRAAPERLMLADCLVAVEAGELRCRKAAVSELRLSV